MTKENVFYKWGAGVGASLPKVNYAYDEKLVLNDGTELIDAAAGAAVVNLGHSLSGISSTASEQIEDVAYISLSNFTHDAPEKVAGQLQKFAPGDLNTSFFVNSGSEANELAIKLANDYHQRRGNPQKSIVIGRWQSYHGATLGALSVTGNTKRRTKYRELLADWPHIPAAYPYRWKYNGTPEEQAIAAAQELETAIKQEGESRVAAFIAEPVSGASIPGAHPHPSYYHEIRRICDEYDVLFIADEVMTGFGRTGRAFGVNHYDIVPDIMTVGKGITGGYAPLSATLVRDHIANEFSSDKSADFAHGHTYSGNPVSTAIASAVLEEYSDGIFSTARTTGEHLRDELSPLERHPMVGEIRQIGLMIGIEFVSNTDTKEPFDPELAVYNRVGDEAFDRGVYLYPGRGSVDGIAGDHIMISPPLTISKESATQIANVAKDAIETTYNSLEDNFTNPK